MVEHHRRLRSDEHYFWGRCTIFISISRGTSASSGVAPAFQQHLFCSSTTRFLFVGGRRKRGRLIRFCTASACGMLPRNSCLVRFYSYHQEMYLVTTRAMANEITPMRRFTCEALTALTALQLRSTTVSVALQLSRERGYTLALVSSYYSAL